MRLWILFGCGVLVVAAAIFPFTRRTEQLAPTPVTPAVAAKPTPSAPPKPEPARVIEVIDLARAYEPVREPEEPAGTVNPASFIPVPETPRPIPPAIELESESPSDCLKAVDDFMGCKFGIRYPVWSQKDAKPRGARPVQSMLQFTPMGEPYAVGPIEALKVMPREVPTTRVSGDLTFTPMSVPYITGITQPIPPNAVIVPTEKLKVIPREVTDLSEIRRLYGYGSHPVRISNIQIEGRILPPVERLKVMPREVGRVKREEQERNLTPEEAEQLGIILPQ